MYWYFGKRFTVANAGATIVDVRCTQCGCQYAYALARVGSGQATAHYGIAPDAAAIRADAASRAELSKRLLQEAELVPCPQCHWINDDLVQGYRRGRYRKWGQHTAYVAIACLALCMIVAWFIHMDPLADRAWLPIILVGGPVAISVVAAAVLALRAWLRQRIRPNRHFPLPPVVPRGTPPALIVNKVTGELTPAATSLLVNPPLGPDAAVELQLGRDELPPICCVCSGEEDSRCGVSVLGVVGLAIHLPLCSSCSRHRRYVRWGLGLLVTAVAVCVAMGVLMLRGLNDDWPVFLIFASIVACVLGGFVSNLVAAPAHVKVIDASRGIVRIRFKDPSFVAHVVAHNARKLAPPALSWVEHQIHNRIDVIQRASAWAESGCIDESPWRTPDSPSLLGSV